MKRSKQKRFLKKPAVLIMVLVLLLGVAGFAYYRLRPKPQTSVTVTKPVSTSKPPAQSPAPTVTTPAPKTGPCQSNSLSKVVIVSISARHMWGCEATTLVYDSAVVTGQENLAADLTPKGTYHIYGKQTNLYLDGSDSTGSWHDHVSYWMPFLSNQYGVYGFHDATWRPDNDFGNIDPYSNKGSHGCVELTLAAGAWLYGWAPIGTTVSII